MSMISQVFAREVLDSRGQPTVEVELRAGGYVGRAIVPSGASTGSAEARELRDGDQRRYDGRGVLHAVANVNDTLAPAVIGMDPVAQADVDRRLLELDATPQKTLLGGNALLGVSLATAQLGAAVTGRPTYEHLAELLARESQRQYGARWAVAPRMPLPMTNMISGGLHAGGNLDFQDILVMPCGAPDYRTGLEWIVRIYRRLGELLGLAGYEGRLVGDEGGFGPRLKSNREAVEFVVRAVEAARLRPGEDVVLAIDVASTHFYREGRYRLAAEANARLTSDEVIERLASWVDEFPIASIEDGLAEEDWEGWRKLTARLGQRVQLVGDDLLATNRARVERAIGLGVANSVLVKVNQIGTLSEAFQTMLVAGRAGWTRVVSARSGETEDPFLADLAVGTAGEQIKIGSIVRSERLAKYNQLLRIAEHLETP